jgi:two-component system nitrogen regulation sensor histidine kinase NtrY
MIMAASILAILLSRSITYSLFLITENLKQVQFGKINLPIKWEVKDEIGLLIQEYNRMINELETSADLLAKSEREIAWREMAKQVAHEIKNPLTPMKLSIQHLQRALYEKRDDVNELTEKVTGRLIEQIDILSDIASAFSDFAKMPGDNFEQINLTKILKSSAELFNDPGKNDIILSFPSEPFIVFGDKNQLTRVFNNILKNAIQAIPEDRIGFIEIDLSTKDNFYKISIKDNGVGISNDQKDRIFVPNFTTKNSGSGLGLAMSKNIIEKIGGSISFVSAENEGTIFTILIPSKNEMIKK